MRRKAIIVIGTAALVAVSFAPPAHSASYGSLKLTGPKPGLVGKQVLVTWTPRYGWKLRSRSLMSLRAYRTDVPGRPTIYAIASRVPVSRRSAAWDSRRVPDGTYFLEGYVLGSRIRSRIGNFTVDNTAPIVRVTRPAPGQVVVDDEVVAQQTPATLVAGSVTLRAAATDARSGVRRVDWVIDERTRRTGSQTSYDFSGEPGEHVVGVRATDAAGNVSSEARVSFTAVPGPDSIVPEPEPTLPPTPEPTLPPTPEPTLPPTPEPTLPPTPEPTVPPLPGDAPLETISVNSADAAGTTSNMILTAGTEYFIAVGGTYLFSASTPGNVADAECSAALQQGAPWGPNHWNGVFPPGESDDPLDVLAGGAAVTWVPTVGSGNGCNEATNEYSLAYTPSVTGPVNFRVDDPAGYADNFGTLTVEIYDEMPDLVAAVGAPASVPAVLAGQALTVGLGVALRRRIKRRARRNTGRGRT